MFFIGCPMWGYKEWVGNFFPAHTASRNFLRVYSERMSAVEGNTTFYALPSQEMVKRWGQETPEGFRFCPKVSRSISHAARLDQSEKETQLFIERIRGLGTRLGPVFIQLPPVFDPQRLPELQAFLNRWPIDVRLAVEVRHQEFFVDPYASILDELLTRYRAARVMMDTRPIRIGTHQEQQDMAARERKPHLPLHVALTTDFAFVRYIGHPQEEVNAPLLEEWARRIGQWVKQGVVCYGFCHCPYEVYSPAICTELYRLVGEQVALPALPSHEEARPQFEQGKLF